MDSGGGGKGGWQKILDALKKIYILKKEGYENITIETGNLQLLKINN